MSIKNKISKQNFKIDIAKISKFINELDPCRLILSGAPIDEYESLTNILLSSLYNNKPKLEIQKILVSEIENYFGAEKVNTELKNAIENLINKSELEIQNKPSH